MLSEPMRYAEKRRNLRTQDGKVYRIRHRGRRQLEQVQSQRASNSMESVNSEKFASYQAEPQKPKTGQQVFRANRRSSTEMTVPSEMHDQLVSMDLPSTMNTLGSFLGGRPDRGGFSHQGSSVASALGPKAKRK